MITLPTAAFVAIALFCYRAKQILENLVYKHKDFSEQRKKTPDPWNSLHFTFNFFKRYNSYKPPIRALP